MGEVVYVNFRKKTYPPENAEKLEYFADLLDLGKTDIMIDAGNAEVLVPADFKGNPALMLSWSHKFRLSDFEYDEEGVSGTLSFNRIPFSVFVPWDAVWMVCLSSDPEGTSRMWECSMPQSIGDLFWDK